MLSIGWTEMMLVAAFALIVVGPRDLPALLRQIGKAMGSVRRMGNEFKAELNKVTAADEIRDIKRSISAPLTETRKQIEQEFNTVTKSGKVVPSGAFKPADPNSESVVNEIHAATGTGPSLEENDAAAKASIATSVAKEAKAQSKAQAKVPAKTTKNNGSAKAKTVSKSRKTAITKSKGKTAAKPAKAAGKPAKPTAKPVKAAAKPTKTAAKPRKTSKPTKTAAKIPSAPKTKRTKTAAKPSASLTSP